MIFLLPFLAATALNAADPERITVPIGKHVLLDGRLETGEWADAKEMPASSAARVFLKCSDRYLYVAIKPTTPAAFGVDLYFDTNGPRLLNLHASAKLTEREGQFDSWPEWKWWNNREWTANVGRIETFQGPSFLEDEAKEFQISLKKIDGQQLALSIDLQTNETVSLPKSEPATHNRH